MGEPSLRGLTPMLRTWRMRWQRVRERARVCYPLEDFDYGMREFAIYDNNGYLLQFGEPIGGEA